MNLCNLIFFANKCVDIDLHVQISLAKCGFLLARFLLKIDKHVR